MASVQVGVVVVVPVPVVEHNRNAQYIPLGLLKIGELSYFRFEECIFWDGPDIIFAKYPPVMLYTEYPVQFGYWM